MFLSTDMNRLGFRAGGRYQMPKGLELRSLKTCQNLKTNSLLNMQLDAKVSKKP